MTAEFWGFPNAETPPGSAYYYVARFSEPRRNEVAAWLAWFAHIDRIAERATDPGASRLRLDWWREEAARALGDWTRHPIAQALAPAISDDWQVRRMRQTLDAVEQRILRHQARRTPEFLDQGKALWGSRMALLAGAADGDRQAAADAAGCYYATVRQLQELHQDLRRDYLPLPRKLLEQQALRIEQLQDPKDNPALATVAGTLLTDAEAKWRAQRPLAADNLSFGPVLRLTAQADRIVRLLRRHGLQVHRPMRGPTPLGLLWSAWQKR